MEGDQLTFFVMYNNHKAILTLSEYDTVEQLKMEIDKNFGISVMDQIIIGWHSIPESVDMILQSCSKSNDINYLAVSHAGTERDSSNTEMEIEAIRSLKEKLPDIPLKVQDLPFQDAVSNIISCFKEKALLLYLHNTQDVFSQNFLAYAYDDEISEILETGFFIVGWDIEDESYHRDLLSALRPFASMSVISHLITEKTSAAVCILLGDNNQPIIMSCLIGDLSYQNVVVTLRNLQGQLKLSNTTRNEASPMEEQDELSKQNELQAMESLRGKVAPSTFNIFRCCTLDDALNFICTSPFDERKALLLYLHNSEHPFSRMFSENLGSGEMVQILNRSFIVLGWDVEERKYHDALASALSHHVNLSIVADLVANKESVGLCIIPIGGTIRIYLCLRGKISLRDTIKKIKEVEIEFNAEISKEKELKQLESKKSNENDMGSEKLHSIWADMLGDRDYDSFEFDQHKFLQEKIGFALRGPPQNESGYDDKTKTQIKELYEIINTQSDAIAEFKDKVEISFIYNCLEPLPDEKIKRANKFEDYNPQTDVNPVPIFVLRKCRGSDEPCRVFIDDTGRVYQNWRGYLTKNKFPKCEMIIPLNGRYQVLNDKVLLEKHLSPACHRDTKLLQVGDIVSKAAGLTSGAVLIAASIPAITVIPPVLITTGVVGASAGGLWMIGRSAHTLIDRSIHKESMSFANSEARGAYLNIVAGSLGFVGAGANIALTQLVKSGANIGQGATYLVNTVGVLNIGAGGASLANSGYEVYKTPSALAIIHLSTSILFFGHAVYSFRDAQTIIDETQARVLKDYSDSLRSNRHRKTFNKLTKETLRTHGDGARGRAEVISAIRNIQNKDEFFAALARNNKAMNRAGIKFSADGGQIKLGGIAVDMTEFIGLNKKQTETFLGNLSEQQQRQEPMTTTTPTINNENISLTTAIKNTLSGIGVDINGTSLTLFLTLTSKVLRFCSEDIQTKVVNAVHEAIRFVLNKLSKPIAAEIDKIIPKDAQFSEFLNEGISFFSRIVDDWEQKYQKYQQTKDPKHYDPLFKYINPVYAKRTVEFFEFVVRNSYSGESLTRAVLEKISSYVAGWITRIIFENEQKKESEERRAHHSANFMARKVHCTNCGGYYFQHT